MEASIYGGRASQARPQLVAFHTLPGTTEEHAPSHQRMLLLPTLGIAAVVLGSALLLSIVFALINTRSEPCRSYACGLFSRRLQESINRSFNPCYSFTRFVCEGWQQQHAHSVRTEIFRSALERLSLLTRNVTRTARALGSGGRTTRERVAALYRSCDAVMRDGRNEMPYVKKALARAGVFWPARSKDPDVMRTVVYLSEVLHWPAIINIRVDNPDEGSDDDWWTTIVVREAHTFPRMLGRQARLRRLNDSRKFFNTLRFHFSSGQDEDDGVTFEQMRAIENKMLTPLRKAYRGLSHDEPKSLDEEDDRLVNRREWSAAVARHWTVPNGRGIRVKATNPAFLRAFLELRRNYGEPDTHLYLSWCAVRYAALFGNMELVLNHYGWDWDKALLNYGRACFAMTYTFVGDLVFALYDADVVRPNTNINVHSLVGDVRAAFVQRVSARKPFSENTSFASRWNTVDSTLRLVDMPTDANVSVDVTLPDVGDSLVTNWLAFWSLIRSPDYVAPRRSLAARPFQDCMFYTLNETENDFVLSPFTLVLPFYDDGITSAVKYGGLGTQVGVASAELAFHFYRHLPDADAALNESRSCLKFSSMSPAVPSASDQLMAELASVEAVLDAFARSGRGDDDRWLVTPDLSAVQVLLITWCFVKCAGRDEPGDGDPCSDVLRHVARFSQAFDCSPETVLNPTHKCTVF